MPANEVLAHCASQLARSSVSRSTNSLPILWLHCPSGANHVTRMYYFVVEWVTRRSQPRSKPSRSFSSCQMQLGLVKGEMLALLTCTCMRVGKSRPPQARRQGGFEGFTRTPLLAPKRFYIHCYSTFKCPTGPLVVSLLLRITTVQASLVAAMRVCSQRTNTERARVNCLRCCDES